MGDLQVQVEVDASEAIDQVTEMLERTLSYKPVFYAARAFLELAYSGNFATSGSQVGGWDPYDPDTGAFSVTGALPDLARTGRLMESLTNLRGKPNEIGHDSATFGTNVPYAKFHQYGTEEMPARKIVFEPLGFADSLGTISGEWITEGLSPADLKELFAS